MRSIGKAAGQQKPSEEDQQIGRKPRDFKPEDVNLSIKAAANQEDTDNHYGGIPETLKLLRSMEDEPWQPLQWIDYQVRAYVPHFISAEDSRIRKRTRYSKMASFKGFLPTLPS